MNTATQLIFRIIQRMLRANAKQGSTIRSLFGGSRLVWQSWQSRGCLSRWPGQHCCIDYYGHIVAPIEALAVLVCCGVLWRRYQDGRIMRVLVSGFAALQLAPVLMWVFFFNDG